MRDNNKRKLIPENIMEEIVHLHGLGVPKAKIIRDLELDMSNPHLTKLIGMYQFVYRKGTLSVEYRERIKFSLFPAWLTDEQRVQPENYSYVGHFPYGMWVMDDLEEVIA